MNIGQWSYSMNLNVKPHSSKHIMDMAADVFLWHEKTIFIFKGDQFPKLHIFTIQDNLRPWVNIKYVAEICIITISIGNMETENS